MKVRRKSPIHIDLRAENLAICANPAQILLSSSRDRGAMFTERKERDMTRNARVCGFLVWAWVAAMACSLIPGGAFAQEEDSGSKVSTDEPIVHLKEFQRKMEHMRKRLSEVQPDPDAVGDVRAGAITLQQHAADVAAVRSEFTKCLASMKKRVADKEESGTATDKDKAEIKQCVDHCQTILDKLNTMHLNATVLGSADHKTKWIVSGLEAHKKAVEEVQALAAKCPDMIQKTLDCCKIKK